MTTLEARHPLRTAVIGGIAATALVLLAGCDSADPGATGTTEGTTPVAQAAQAVQGQFISVVKDIGPSVVQITTDQGLGSGVVFDTKGDIVTNNHVVAGSNTFQVTLANGKQYPARFVGSFRPDDLAVLHINAPGLQAPRSPTPRTCPSATSSWPSATRSGSRAASPKASSARSAAP